MILDRELLQLIYDYADDENADWAGTHLLVLEQWEQEVSEEREAMLRDMRKSRQEELQQLGIGRDELVTIHKNIIRSGASERHILPYIKSLAGIEQIDDVDIANAKQYPIAAIFGSYGLTGKRISGSREIMKCPFHNEDTPSCTLFKKTNTFYCFGCGVGGDSIRAEMELGRVGFLDAVKNLVK